jgi:hypothetical protein
MGMSMEAATDPGGETNGSSSRNAHVIARRAAGRLACQGGRAPMKMTLQRQFERPDGG